MTIIGHIRSGHSRQRQLAAGILEAADGAGEGARLFDLLCDEVEAQAAAKEQTFYAALLSLIGDQVITRRAVEAHDAAAVLIGDLSDMPAGSSEWRAGIGRLAKMLDRHAAIEEEALALAGGLLGADHAAQLGDRFQVARNHWIEAFGRVPAAAAAPAPLRGRAAMSRRVAAVLPTRAWFQKLGRPLRLAPGGHVALPLALRERRPATDYVGAEPARRLPTRGR